ncbi:MAG: YbbC/YhhH family protein [Bacteroidales bacterium]|nr:YbbC/YhhH family protein [Bacteroidales bacterium]MCM1148129.1 YbbC/YhhH family protein [Bacteroidales bacterium]MCM1206545.1 YbbC/YhhH family protein [Bacillota bacterium]MCM1510553.1 YbbC/YhhH family protein [Clostridium sp.]
MKKTDILFIWLIIICCFLLLVDSCLLREIKRLYRQSDSWYGKLVFVRNSDLERFDSVKFEKRESAELHEKPGAKPVSTAVATSGTAAQIAEAVFYAMKGYDYYNYNVTSVTLIQNRYWIVEARVPYSKRALIVEINKKDGQILRIFDGKFQFQKR